MGRSSRTSHIPGPASPGDRVARVAATLRFRSLRDRGLAEVPSTRLLIAAGRLVASGISVREACRVAVVSPLSDDPTLLGAMRELVDAMFP